VKIVITHKLGDCPVGEVSVLIAISSVHRKESLAAVAFAIDELKSNVPIWKKVRIYFR
jgi:molybdopterin synthase catalytic subunit